MTLIFLICLIVLCRNLKNFKRKIERYVYMWVKCLASTTSIRRQCHHSLSLVFTLATEILLFLRDVVLRTWNLSLGTERSEASCPSRRTFVGDLGTHNPRSQGRQTLLIFWWTKYVLYNRVVLVCTVNVYIPTSMGRRPILRYQVLKVRKNYTYFPYNLRTDSYVFCREYCKQFEINTARRLLSAVFIARHFK